MTRLASIGGAELLLLWRNWFALSNALLLPPFFGLLFIPQLAEAGMDAAPAPRWPAA